MIKTIFLISLLLLKYNTVFATVLNMAIEEAINYSKELKIQQYYLKSANSTQYEAYSEFLPDVAVNIQYGEKKNNSLVNHDKFTDEENQTITLSQPLFQGFGGISKLKQGKNIYLSSSYAYQKFKQELIIKVIISYLNLYKVRKELAIAQQNQDLYHKILEQINLQKNLISESDKIHYQINLANSVAFVEESKATLAQETLNYKILVGKIDEDLILPQIKNLNTDQILKQEIENHPIVKEKYHNYLASKAHTKSNLSKFSPKVNLIARGSKQKDVIYLDGKDQETRSIYIDISIPIFQKGLEYSGFYKLTLRTSLTFNL